MKESVIHGCPLDGMISWPSFQAACADWRPILSIHFLAGVLTLSTQKTCRTGLWWCLCSGPICRTQTIVKLWENVRLLKNEILHRTSFPSCRIVCPRPQPHKRWSPSCTVRLLSLLGVASGYRVVSGALCSSLWACESIKRSSFKISRKKMNHNMCMVQLMLKPSVEEFRCRRLGQQEKRRSLK
jgi:hypothetical protein